MGNVNMEAYQVHFEGKSVAEKLKELDETVKENEQEIDSLSDIVSIKADRIDIAPIFSEESAYSAGDLVYNSNSLWKFSVDHAAGDWDPSEVSAVNIDMELSELKNTITANKVVGSTAVGLEQNQTFTPTTDILVTINVLSGKVMNLYTKDSSNNLVKIIEISNTSNNANFYSFIVKKGMPILTASSSTNGSASYRKIT